ncbi:MAG TPA: tetratricopeptide repeat protein [Planctomycetota bacterium]|nr:tetratricopeptide repeat protein [Planctomycetota bacterium]
MRLRLLSLSLLALACVFFTPGCEEARGLDPRERAAMTVVFEEARALDEQGRYHEALVRYETVLARHPQFMSTRLNAAMAAYDAGAYEKARGHFEVLHKYGPGDWFVIRKLIQCCERLNDKEGVESYRAKLEKLRQQAAGSVVLKRYEGLTRDYIPVGSMHLIGYEFFEPKKHGRLWFFRLEDKNKAPVTAFLLEATPFHDNSGRRLFSLTEATNGWMRIWHVGVEGREYAWTRDVVLSCLQGKRQPLVVKPLPADYEVLAAPDSARIPSEGKEPPSEKAPIDAEKK